MYPDYTPLDMKRFWSKVDKTDNPDECWNWTLSTTDGYGRIRIQNQTLLAHKVAYELSYRKVPDDLCVLHICDNRACCRPDHLLLGTNKDNVDDRERKGRGGNHKGEAHGRHRLTLKQVAIIRERYSAGGISTRALAREYGITHGHVYRIISGKAWV